MYSIRYTVLLLVLFSFGSTAVANMQACMPGCAMDCIDCRESDLPDGASDEEQCVNCTLNGVNAMSQKFDTDTPSTLDSGYCEHVFSDRVDAPDPFPPKQHTLI